MSVYIIAEIGSNWIDDEGRINYLKQVSKAKECGADAVKFQFLTYKELYGVEKAENSLDIYSLSRKAENSLDIYSLGRDEIALIHKECEKVGIDFLCSAFSKEGYNFINKFVHMHKIASSEASDKELIDHVCGFGKKVMVSVGGLTSGQVLKLVPNDKIIITECVAKYPASFLDYDFRLIANLDHISENDLAFSDHTIGSSAAMLAKNMGVEIFEKHVDFFHSTKNPDSPVSMGAIDFIDYCNKLRSLDKFKRTKNPSQRTQLEHGFFRPEPD